LSHIITNSNIVLRYDSCILSLSHPYAVVVCGGHNNKNNVIRARIMVITIVMYRLGSLINMSGGTSVSRNSKTHSPATSTEHEPRHSSYPPSFAPTLCAINSNIHAIRVRGFSFSID
jgi:hypothetical protein